MIRCVVQVEKVDGSTFYMGRLATLVADLDDAEVVSETMGNSYAISLRNVKDVQFTEVVRVKLQLA